jgi:hypothetical protein
MQVFSRLGSHNHGGDIDRTFVVYSTESLGGRRQPTHRL